MKLSYRWLNEYVSVTASPKEFSDRMTMTGSKVETYETEGSDLQNIVVGKILSIEKHPDADKLLVCQVDIGQETLQIVTGATNLQEGDIVPVALDNSIVHGGKKIKKGKLRGVESYGMLCSLAELGLSLCDFPYALEDGIFVLQEDCRLGQDIHEAIGLNDTTIEFEITSNRPDCLSIFGLAREAAASFDLPLTSPDTSVKTGQGDVTALMDVQIHDADLCYRYTGAVVQNVRIAPSPRWMRERLRACGVRPINNIVDITNYVMLEYGQPMHAFDLRYLDGNAIHVRRAKRGENITLLDGTEKELAENMLVIADCQKPVAVAGVMGGEHSGIMPDTQSILFESACFNGSSVRTTAKALGVRTESSARFEKELDPTACIPALQRALHLVQLLDAGDVVEGMIDRNKSIEWVRTIPFQPDWISRFLGIDCPAATMQSYLEKVACKVEGGQILVPSFRRDLEHPADIAEEVARFYGYETIPSTPLRGSATGQLTARQKFLSKAGQCLRGCGCSEIVTYSFMGPKAYDKIGLPEDSPLRRSLTLQNPLGEDTSIMRTTALPSMLEVLSLNYNNRNDAAWLYEFATEYIPVGPDTLPEEKQKIILGAYGGQMDFFALKGMVEELLDTLSLTDYEVEALQDEPAFHPNRTAALRMGEKHLGVLGEIHPLIQENFEIGQKVYVAILDVALCFGHTQTEKAYRPLPKYPATSRDLALICEASTPVSTLQKTIAQAIGRNLEKIALFDVYQGAQIQESKKSVAFSLTLRSNEGTLTDEEADAAIQKALKSLAKIGIFLRN